MDLKDIKQIPPLSLEALPDDILLHLLQFLDLDEIKVVSMVCHRFQLLSDSEHIWKHQCLEKGLGFKCREMSWKETFHLDIKDTCIHLSSVERSQTDELWCYLQSLYTKGKNLRCSHEGCSLPSNTLWVCLSCPHAGCGRRYQAHAKLHYEETGHMLSVKLLTLEFSCYICEQWLGEESRPQIEKERIEEIYSWLHSSCPAEIKHLYMDVDVKKRRQKERGIRWAEDSDPYVESEEFADYRTWSVFPAKWYETWLDFVVGDCGPPTTAIDNSGFITNTGRVRNNLSAESVVILSNEQWEFLSQVYGGGPHIQWDNANRKWLVHQGDPDQTN